jgi:hypothetical protein
MAWKISLHQKPVGFGDRQHNFIVVEDDEGNPWAEFNGGPVDKNGRFIPLDPSDLSSINSRLSGGILGADVRRFPFDRPLNRKDPDARLLQEVPVTREQALAAINAAQACSKEINDLRLPYRLTGTGPEIDRNSESNAPVGPAGFNSNGVFSTLLACMGVTPTHPAIESQPGSGQLVLPPSRIGEIRQQYQSSSPGEQIPLPRARPQIRGDNSNGPQPALPSGPAYQETGVRPGYVPQE